MSRGIYPSVKSCGPFWIVSALVLAVSAVGADAHSCHEVKMAFQLRQVGPPHRVPETPGTDVDLLVCKHQGPSCCNRKMEESYQFAVRRETLHNIHSYSYELEHLLSGHSDAFRDMFQYLLSFSQGHLSSLLDRTYSSLSRRALPHVNQLFSSLSLYLRGANISVEASVHQFFNNLFPLTYTALINPGMDGGGDIGDCLRMIRQDVNPFGPHPVVMAQELAGALEAGRQLGLAMDEGLLVMNATKHVSLSKECMRGLVKMVYCSHCRGLTLIKPCPGYCLNVMRGCLASVSELDQPWRRYVGLLEQLTHAIAGHHSLELALLGVRDHVNEALLYAQLHGPIVTATVDKVCGLSTAEPTGTQPTSPQVTTSSVTSSSFPPPSADPTKSTAEQRMGQFAHLRSSFPLKPSKNNRHSLKSLSREFLLYLQRYKSFFAALPEMMCEGETVVDGSTCWVGNDLAESYGGRVVGNGLLAQRQNPEVKVRVPNPVLVEVKEDLEHFIQETYEAFPKLDQIDTWDELGSGETREGGSADCDDEDGCQASGDGQSQNSHTQSPGEGKPMVRQPGGDSAQKSTAKPPVVKVIGGTSRGSQVGPWMVALLSTLALFLQWSLF